MSGDTLDFLQGNRETLTGTLHDPAATTGDVLTVQADKSIAAAPGGGVGAAVQATYSSNPVAIPDGASAQLTFDTLSSGVDLLDRTDPANPKFLADGTYAVAVSVSGDDLTAAGYAILTLAYSVAGEVGSSFTQETPYPGWSVGATFIASAGDTLFCTIYNKDGASPRNFTIVNAVIVKL